MFLGDLYLRGASKNIPRSAWFPLAPNGCPPKTWQLSNPPSGTVSIPIADPNLSPSQPEPSGSDGSLYRTQPGLGVAPVSIHYGTTRIPRRSGHPRGRDIPENATDAAASSATRANRVQPLDRIAPDACRSPRTVPSRTARTAVSQDCLFGRAADRSSPGLEPPVAPTPQTPSLGACSVTAATSNAVTSGRTSRTLPAGQQTGRPPVKRYRGKH